MAIQSWNSRHQQRSRSIHGRWTRVFTFSLSQLFNCPNKLASRDHNRNQIGKSRTSSILRTSLNDMKTSIAGTSMTTCEQSNISSVIREDNWRVFVLNYIWQKMNTVNDFHLLSDRKISLVKLKNCSSDRNYLAIFLVFFSLTNLCCRCMSSREFPHSLSVSLGDIVFHRLKLLESIQNSHRAINFLNHSFPYLPEISPTPYAFLLTQLTLMDLIENLFLFV